MNKIREQLGGGGGLISTRGLFNRARVGVDHPLGMALRLPPAPCPPGRTRESESKRAGFGAQINATRQPFVHEMLNTVVRGVVGAQTDAR